MCSPRKQESYLTASCTWLLVLLQWWLIRLGAAAAAAVVMIRLARPRAALQIVGVWLILLLPLMVGVLAAVLAAVEAEAGW